MVSQGQPDNSSVLSTEFPIGLRVLVVDDDPICLLILDRMLQRCRYKVTTCGGAVEALRVLRENKDGFDVVISDVHMPDMDGFKLLELVGLEMDLPVIMMSANGETSAVMKGIKHGACDYLLKPVRIEELKNIWQHVVRRKKREGAVSDNVEDQQLNDGGGEYHSSDGPDAASSRQSKKRKEDDDDAELDNDDPSTSKKPRVVWSVELHQKFVTAVNQLGIDKAVPKRVLELMDVRGLTRENVASHLQKYRLYLKRISEVPHHRQAGGLGSTMLGSPDPSFGIAGSSFGEFVSSKSSLPSGSIDRSVLSTPPGLDLYTLRQLAAVHGANTSAIATRSPYGLPLSNNISSGYLINQVGTRQSGSFGQSGNSTLSSGPVELHRLPSLPNMGGLDPMFSSLDSCLPIENNSNDALVAQILQQQASASIGLPMTSTEIRPKLQEGRSVGAFFDARPEHNEFTLHANSPNSMRRPVVDNFGSLDIPYLSTSLASDAIVKTPILSETLDVGGSRNTNASIIQPGNNTGVLVSNPNASLNSLQGWHSLIQNNPNLGPKSELESSSHFNQDYGQSFKAGCLSGLQEGGLYNNRSLDQCIRDNNKFRLKDTPLSTKACTGMLDDTLISYTKQAQAAVVSQPEGNFNIGNYTLGNMHVK